MAVRMRGMKRQTVPALADAIREAMTRQHLDDVQALVVATGLTRQGLAPLLAGERRNYQGRLKHPVCRALGWSPDSIDRILAGDDPIVIAEPPRTGRVTRSELDHVWERIDHLADLVEWHGRRLQDAGILENTPPGGQARPSA